MSNTIAGNVYAGGVGVVGATVSWTGSASGSTTSGAGGAYTTSALSAGTYNLTCADTVSDAQQKLCKICLLC